MIIIVPEISINMFIYQVTSHLTLPDGAIKKCDTINPKFIKLLPSINIIKLRSDHKNSNSLQN